MATLTPEQLEAWIAQNFPNGTIGAQTTQAQPTSNPGMLVGNTAPVITQWATIDEWVDHLITPLDDDSDQPEVAAEFDMPIPDITTTPIYKKAVVRKSPADKTGIFSEIYQYRQLNFNRSACNAFERQYKPQSKPFKWSTEEGMVGIEIEVENITQGFQASPHWSTKDDGSLRNHGIELVSVPLLVRQIQPALESVYEELHRTNKPDFSNRTSIHVHLNCRDLTQDQVYVLVLLYSIFEKHFYGFAGTKRLNSIFCVPIYRCNILAQAKDLIYGFSPVWHKYCGLNLSPLIDQSGQRGYGTVEFRHLYGTSDVNVVLQWIDQILCLRKACTEIKKEDLLNQIQTMNTTSDYLALYYRIFTIPAQVKDKQVFEECISNIKRELYSRMYEEKLVKDVGSKYWVVNSKLGVRG